MILLYKIFVNMKHNHYHKLILVLSLLMNIDTFATYAQDNPFKIDNALYSIYQRAFKLRNTTQGLRIADTLYIEAVEKHDLKAQCLAFVISVNHYSNRESYDSLTVAVNKCQEKARENNYLQYYYYAYGCQIVWLLNHGNTLQALQLSENMKNEAFKDKSSYGIVLCLRHQGYIYQMRKNEDMAANCYEEAVEYMLKYSSDQDPTSFYILLSEYNRNKRPPLYTEALQCTEKALDLAKSYESYMGALMEKCIIMYHLKRTGDFDTLYNKCFREMKTYGIVQRKKAMLLRIYKTFLTGNYELAYKMTDSVGNIYDTYELKRRISLAKGDYRKAYKCSEWLSRYNDSIRLQIQSSDLAELTARFGNERIKQENELLKLKNMRQGLILGLMLIVFLFFIYILLKQRKIDSVLKKKNEELKDMRDKAESANQMKSFFIHNMSHEIRTPLNAIVGFSQILASTDVETSLEEKQDFSSLIHYNAELLTTLINDILDLAALESGKYTMNVTSHHSNELCRLEIASVMHRKPEGVNLYFTTEVTDDYEITTDGQRLRQVLTNFLTNSMKHTEEGEIHLHCSLSEHPGKITFSVTDTGTGVPADKVDALFGRFAKLNDTKQGTGLGLNICRIIAERLGGEVMYDKTYTNGARFELILPLDSQRSS